MGGTDKEITAFVNALAVEEDVELGKLFAATYNELRSLAHAQRRHWPGQETLSTTALVHEAYVKLSQQNELAWQDRGHFFRIAARAVRFILVNYAQRGRAAKRGGDSVHVSLEEASLVEDPQTEELLALDEALSRLAREHPRWAQVVECRFFAGLGIEETAEAVGVSLATVKRDWSRGQAWLYQELAPQPVE